MKKRNVIISILALVLVASVVSLADSPTYFQKGLLARDQNGGGLSPIFGWTSSDGGIVYGRGDSTGLRVTGVGSFGGALTSGAFNATTGSFSSTLDVTGAVRGASTGSFTTVYGTSVVSSGGGSFAGLIDSGIAQDNLAGIFGGSVPVTMFTAVNGAVRYPTLGFGVTYDGAYKVARGSGSIRPGLLQYETAAGDLYFYSATASTSAGSVAPIANNAYLSSAGNWIVGGSLKANTTLQNSDGAVYSCAHVLQTGACASDERLKQGIAPLSSSLDVLAAIMGIDAIYYQWNAAKTTLRTLTPTGKEIGVSAQDVQRFFPELVHTVGNTSVLTVEYDRLAVVALAGIQAQQEQIAELQQVIMTKDTQITELRDALSVLAVRLDKLDGQSTKTSFTVTETPSFTAAAARPARKQITYQTGSSVDGGVQ